MAPTSRNLLTWSGLKSSFVDSFLLWHLAYIGGTVRDTKSLFSVQIKTLHKVTSSICNLILIGMNYSVRVHSEHSSPWVKSWRYFLKLKGDFSFQSRCIFCLRRNKVYLQKILVQGSTLFSSEMSFLSQTCSPLWSCPHYALTHIQLRCGLRESALHNSSSTTERSTHPLTPCLDHGYFRSSDLTSVFALDCFKDYSTHI